MNIQELIYSLESRFCVTEAEPLMPYFGINVTFNLDEAELSLVCRSFPIFIRQPPKEGWKSADLEMRFWGEDRYDTHKLHDLAAPAIDWFAELCVKNHNQLKWSDMKNKFEFHCASAHGRINLSLADEEKI